MLSKAIQLAYKAHKWQLDKQWLPYIFHPMRVAIQMTTEDEKIVALLHDVIEDSDITASFLLLYWFEKHIVDAVVILTRARSQKKSEYREYLEKVKLNELARVVKIEDLKDNLRPDRKWGKNRSKYLKALIFLQS